MSFSIDVNIVGFVCGITAALCLSGSEASAVERVDVPVIPSRVDIKDSSEPTLLVSASTATQEVAAKQGLYQCITQDNTPLWYNGVALRLSNKGQGLYDVMDFGGQRIHARLWGGGSISWQIDRWNVGWCG
ncbi:hypothetical protein [Amycolatopsis sp. lyj-90]|uniref:hypothetical protein n=1 Tax=Amycolatopsis sp. lyj-90 TaxID=2789285 RepID=UPI00397886D7